MCMYASQKRQMLQRRGGTFGIPDKTEPVIVSLDYLYSNYDLNTSTWNYIVVCNFFGFYDDFQLSEQTFH